MENWHLSWIYANKQLHNTNMIVVLICCSGNLILFIKLDDQPLVHNIKI